MTLWPPAATGNAFDAIGRNEDLLRPGIDAICRQDGVPGRIERFADGSLPVYAVGTDHVLKVYPPAFAAERDREHVVLDVLAGRLPIPTPRPLGIGAVDGWGYVWMERLRGASLALCWPHVDGEHVARAVGECLAVLHGVRDPRLGAVSGDWLAFVEEQRRTCVDRQRARGLDERWVEQIPAFLEAFEADPQTALLHTEVMREHLRIDGDRLSGLFDFEPAMLGAPEYELASVGLFVSCGNPALFREVLRGYGHPSDTDLARRVLGYALLHRYSNLPWYLRRVPPPDSARTLEDLAVAWFGTG